MSIASDSVKNSNIESLRILHERNGVTADLVHLQEDLLRYRLKELESLFLPGNFPSAEQIADGLADGQCLTEFATLDFPENKLDVSLRRFRDTPSLAGTIPDRLWKALNDDVSDVRRLGTFSPTAVSDAGSSLSHELTQDDADLLRWLSREFYKPFYHYFAQQIPASSIERWQHGECPCCGGPPKLARLTRDSGSRRLWCDLCSIEWPISRLRCPFCGNEDAEQLANLEFDDPAHCRVAVCEKCKGFLCTVDERKLSEYQQLNLEIEALAMLPLEIVAEQRGYRWPGRFED